MEEIITKNTLQEETVPYIKRNIDGVEYTVKIHFHPGSRENAKDKMKRLIMNDALTRNFLE